MCKDTTPVDGTSVLYNDDKPLDPYHPTNALEYPKEFEKYLKFIRSKIIGRDIREAIARLAQITYKYTEVSNNTSKEDINKVKDKLLKDFSEELNRLKVSFKNLKSSLEEEFKNQITNKLDNILNILKSQNKEDFEKFKNEISKVNASAELVDARGGFNTLKEYLNIISLLDTGKLHEAFPHINIYDKLKKHLYAFGSSLDAKGYFPPNGEYIGTAAAQKGNFLSLFSAVLKDTTKKNDFSEQVFRFLRVYVGSSSFSDDKAINTYAGVQLTPMYQLLKSKVIVGGKNPFSNPIYVNLPYSDISFIRFELEDGSMHTRRIRCEDEDIKKSHHSLIYWKAIYDDALQAGWGGNFQYYAPRWGCVKFCIESNKLKLWFTSGDIQVSIRHIEIAKDVANTKKILEVPLERV